MKFLRFDYQGKAGFGVVEADGLVRVYDGDMFGAPTRTGVKIPMKELVLRTPCVPGKMIALWNNSRIQIEKLQRETPKEVLWFLKPSSSFSTHGRQSGVPYVIVPRQIRETCSPVRPRFT